LLTKNSWGERGPLKLSKGKLVWKKGKKQKNGGGQVSGMVLKRGFGQEPKKKEKAGAGNLRLTRELGKKMLKEKKTQCIDGEKKKVTS